MSALDRNEELRREVEDLTLRLEEAEETLQAIRTGGVDALVVRADGEDRIYTLEGADRAHRIVLESMFGGAMTLAENGTVLYANKRFSQLVGTSQEQVVGADFRRFVCGPELPRFEEILSHSGSRGCQAELALAGPSGDPVLTMISLSPLSLGDGSTARVVVAIDVTELRQTQAELERANRELARANAALERANVALEERVQERTAELLAQKEWLRVTLTSIGDAVIVTNPQGEIVFMNRVAERLTGWLGETGVGRPLGEVFRILDEETRQPAPSPVTRVIERGTIQGLANHTLLVDRDGVERSIDDSGAPIWDADGALLGVVLVFRDIGDRRRAEQDREHYLRAIEEANQAKDLFFNTLSHELRTPLAAMLNSIEVLKHPEATKGQRTRVVSLLERNVRHQTHLIDDLLDLSRIMRGKVELAHEPLDLRQIAEEQAEAVETSVRKARHDLVLDLPLDPVPVSGDPVRLGQVISNLLVNAVKFTEPGGTISLHMSVQDDRALVRVTDTGIGMTPELLGQLFEPFRQGDAALTRSKGGLGIGLAIARSLAELHQGTLLASSEGVGCGSEFTLALPLRKEASSHERAPKRSARPCSRRVLVIEDNADLLESLTLLLRLLGHTAIGTADGRTGIEAALSEKPDLALIDIGLPDMDGYGVARELRDRPATKDLQLVALTGYATPEHRDRAFDAGFNEHLAKPVDAEELQRVLAGPAPGASDAPPSPQKLAR